MIRTALHILIRLGVSLLVLTAVGQIPSKGRNLENRYHEAVNSPKFQKTFWVAVRPVTWTSEKITELYADQVEKRHNRNRASAR